MAAATAERAMATLHSLPAVTLRQASLACGGALTGRKLTVAERLTALAEGRLPNKDPCRVLSIDLGLQNIGICRMLVPAAAAAQPLPVVEAWDVVSLPADLRFSYPPFADAAIMFVREQLGTPADAVLIERQRSRTGGSPAIPNSILRVNILEGMLFAAVQTLFPDVYVESISPRQVVDWWREVFDDASRPSRGATKKTVSQNYRESKHMRRLLLSHWISHPDAAPLRFAPNVDVVRRGKRDDMDDALVQALTWARWRANSCMLLANIAAARDPLAGLEVPPTSRIPRPKSQSRKLAVAGKDQ